MDCKKTNDNIKLLFYFPIKGDLSSFPENLNN